MIAHFISVNKINFPLSLLELFIERFCMTGGNSPIGYLKAYHTNLYLSADSKKVMEALAEGKNENRTKRTENLAHPIEML